MEGDVYDTETEEVIGFVKGWAKNKNKKGFGNVDLNDMGLTILFEADALAEMEKPKKPEKEEGFLKKKEIVSWISSIKKKGVILSGYWLNQFGKLISSKDLEEFVFGGGYNAFYEGSVRRTSSEKSIKDTLKEAHDKLKKEGTVRTVELILETEKIILSNYPNQKVDTVLDENIKFKVIKKGDYIVDFTKKPFTFTRRQ